MAGLVAVELIRVRGNPVAKWRGPLRARVACGGCTQEVQSAEGAEWGGEVMFFESCQRPAAATVEVIGPDGTVLCSAVACADGPSCTEQAATVRRGPAAGCEVVLRAGHPPCDEPPTPELCQGLAAVADRGEALLAWLGATAAATSGRRYSAAEAPPYAEALGGSGGLGRWAVLLALLLAAVLPAFAEPDSWADRAGRALLPLVLLWQLQRVRRAAAAPGALAAARCRSCVAAALGADADGEIPAAALRSAALAARWLRRAAEARSSALRLLRWEDSAAKPLLRRSAAAAAALLCLSQIAEGCVLLPAVLLLTLLYASALAGKVHFPVKVLPAEPVAAKAAPTPAAEQGPSAGERVVVDHEVEGEDGQWTIDSAEAMVARVDARGVWVRFEGGEPDDPLYCSPPQYVRRPSGTDSIAVGSQVTVWLEEENENGEWVVVSANGRVAKVEGSAVDIDWGDGSPPYRCERRFIGAAGEAAARQLQARDVTAAAPSAAPETVEVWYEEEQSDGGGWTLTSARAEVLRELRGGAAVEVRWVDDEQSPPFVIARRFLGPSGQRAAEEEAAAARAKVESGAVHRTSSVGRRPAPAAALCPGDAVAVAVEQEGADGEWAPAEADGVVARVSPEGVWVQFAAPEGLEPPPLYCAPPDTVRHAPGAAPRAAFEAGEAVTVTFEIEDERGQWSLDSAAATVARVDAKGVWVRWEGGGEEELYCTPPQHVRPRGAAGSSSPAAAAAPSAAPSPSHCTPSFRRAAAAAAAEAVAIAVCPHCKHVQAKKWRGSAPEAAMRCAHCGHSSPGWADGVDCEDPRAEQFREGAEVVVWYEEETDSGQWVVRSDKARIVRVVGDGTVELRWLDEEAAGAGPYVCHTRFLASPAEPLSPGDPVRVCYEEEGPDGGWRPAVGTGKVARLLPGGAEAQVDWGDGSPLYTTPLSHVAPAPAAAARPRSQ
eukprot:TRINITY_DN14913_c2_g1_i1.p1 TRINITY_DN14913_c2_g1~~TRINITY_DN14913_c2_g1_i1.p1  ORF type:complete len:969 (+),score=254.82 TRINITY_DN14913_c2_g1_i1:70-2907(+)